jgi:[protein-PII] uridylyltransferase
MNNSVSQAPSGAPASSAQALKQSRETLLKRLEARVPPSFPEALAHAADTYFEERVRELTKSEAASAKPFCVVAVGGYGRRTLCPGSDIDVLVIYPGRIPGDAEPFARELFHPLWDVGLKVGHGVRSVKDCASLAASDFQVLTSLLTARFLCGNEETFSKLLRTVHRKAVKGREREIARAAASEARSREETFGDSASLLEPDLKNGIGGLRDIQTVDWLVRIAPDRNPFLPEEMTRLRRQEEFLLRVRTALHHAAGRGLDRLHFDLQRQVATLLGYVAPDDEADKAGRAVEFFLTRLHSVLGNVAAMREAAVLHVAGQHHEAQGLPQGIAAEPEGLRFAQGSPEPERLLDIFTAAASTGIPLSWRARRAVSASVAGQAEILDHDPELFRRIMELFTLPHARSAVLPLSRTGLLGAVLPPFERVRHFVQFDDIHVHPAGRHTLATCAAIGDMIAGRRGTESALSEHIEHPEPLLLAAMFHDLGKEEPDHEQAGEMLARDSLLQLEYGRDVIEDVAFLVRNHLLLPATAARHDPEDPAAVEAVAKTCGTVRRLDMLHLLTAADAEATGPKVSGSWNRSLRERLYHSARAILEKGGHGSPDTVLHADVPFESVPDVTAHMLVRIPEQARRRLSPETLAEHADMVAELDTAVAQDRVRKPGGKGGIGVNVIRSATGPVPDVREVTVAAHDSPGLFSTVAGCMALLGLSILSADIFTWEGDTAVDVFTVGRENGSAPDEGLLKRLSSNITWAMAGKLDVSGRLAEKRSSLLAPRRGPDLPLSVRIDNEADPGFTLLEISAPDRIGLLHDLARVLSDLGLDIGSARVSTISGRALDVFRVCEADGSKLSDGSRIRNLRRALTRVGELY